MVSNGKTINDYTCELIEAKIELAILKYELVKLGYRIPEKNEDGQ